MLFSSGLNFSQKFNLNIFELDTFSTSNEKLTNVSFMVDGQGWALNIFFTYIWNLRVPCNS